MLIGFDAAKIQQFPDIPALSADFLMRRSGRGFREKKEGRHPCAVAFGAALLECAQADLKSDC
jgi:hypothetical protein